MISKSEVKLSTPGEASLVKRGTHRSVVDVTELDENANYGNLNLFLLSNVNSKKQIQFRTRFSVAL